MPISTPSAAATKRVIVADDTAFVRERFKSALEDAGHHLTTAGNGAELVAQVRAAPAGIDLVVLDLRLPQTQGVRMVRALREIQGFQAAVVVFSGTIANAQEVRDLAALGVSGYVNEYTAVQHIVPSLAPHLFPDRHNRRTGPRVVLGVPVAYRLGNTIAAAVTLNIGSGGLAIRTTNPLETGTAVKVRFRLPGAKKEVDADARVTWTSRRLGMGLQFTRLDSADQTILDEFVQTHFFSYRKA